MLSVRFAKLRLLTGSAECLAVGIIRRLVLASL